MTLITQLETGVREPRTIPAVKRRVVIGVAERSAQEEAAFLELMQGPEREFRSGESYLWQERRTQGALVAFRELVEAGYQGLYVTRTHPGLIPEGVTGPGVKVIWLSTQLGPQCLDPSKLNNLNGIVNQFLTENPKSAILLDGLEYISTNNESRRVIHFLEATKESCAERESILLLSVDPRAFSTQEQALLERGCTILNG